MMAEVPLPEAGRLVPLRSQHLRNGSLFVADAILAVRPEGTKDTNAIGIAASDERSPRCRANGLSHIEAGELNAFGSQAIEVGCAMQLAAKASEVAITHVVSIDEDNVVLLFRPEGIREVDCSEHEQKQSHGTIPIKRMNRYCSMQTSHHQQELS